MPRFSIFKRAVRAAQLALTALACIVALNFGIATPAVAGELQVLPAPQLALFGFGRQAEGKAEQLEGKVQSAIDNKVKGTAKQVQGRAKSDIGRVEAAASRTIERQQDLAKDNKKGLEKNLDRAKNVLDNAADNVKDSIGK